MAKKRKRPFWKLVEVETNSRTNTVTADGCIRTTTTYYAYRFWINWGTTTRTVVKC